MLPFELIVAVAVVPPAPSKVCEPTSAIGPAISGGATIVPVDVYAKVPCKLVLEHPLSWAFAADARLKANAAIAATVNVFAKLRFIMISFVFLYSSGKGLFKPFVLPTGT